MLKQRIEYTGYGGLDIPTFYGMMCFTPDSFKNFNVTYDHSWQQMWEKAIKVSDVNLKLSHEINSVEYDNVNNAINIIYNNNQLTKSIKKIKKTFTEEFDFCIFAVPGPNKLIKNITYKQKKYLSLTNNYKPALTILYEYKPTLNKKVKNLDTALIIPSNQYPLKTKLIYKKYKDSKMEVSYHYSQHLKDKSKLEENQEFISNTLIKDMKKKYNKEIKIINKSFYPTYFPHFNCDDILNGSPWELLKL